MRERFNNGLLKDSLAWSDDGLDRFLDSLVSPGARELYERQADGKPVVAVYGKSQVGKTELILRLMGVDVTGEGYNDVRQALRGYRKRGQSASATATIYRRSENASFSIRIGSRRKSDLTTCELGKVLKDLREEVHEGKYEAEEAIEIWLPSSLFFDPVMGEDANPIIDLPGAESSEAQEQHHVGMLLRRYLPLASAVLLVFRAENLTTLGSITQPELRGWRKDTEIFRLIGTYAFSPDSIRRQIDKGRTYEEVISHYWGQLCNSVRGVNSSFQDRLHLVEYGDSWRTLRAEKPDYCALFEGEIRKSLQSIASSLPPATREASIVGFAHAHGRLRRAGKRHRMEARAVVRELELKMVELQADLQRVEGALGLSEREIASIDSQRAELASPPIPNLETRQLPSGKVDCKILRTELDAGKAELRRSINAFHDDMLSRQTPLKLDLSWMDDILEEATADITNLLNSYFTDFYLRPNREKHDKEAVAFVLELAASNASARLASALQREVLRVDNVLRKRRLKAIRERNRFRRISDRIRSELASLAQKVESENQSLVEIETLTAKDLSTAQRYLDFLLESFLRAVKEEKDWMADPGRDSTEWLSGALNLLRVTDRGHRIGKVA